MFRFCFVYIEIMATIDNRKLLDFLANQVATDNTENSCDVNKIEPCCNV